MDLLSLFRKHQAITQYYLLFRSFKGIFIPTCGNWWWCLLEQHLSLIPMTDVFKNPSSYIFDFFHFYAFPNLQSVIQSKCYIPILSPTAAAPQK